MKKKLLHPLTIKLYLGQGCLIKWPDIKEYVLHNSICTKFCDKTFDRDQNCVYLWGGNTSQPAGVPEMFCILIWTMIVCKYICKN